MLVGQRVDGRSCGNHGHGTLNTFRRILLPAVLPAAAAAASLNFNNLLEDYDTAVFLAHPVYQPLGLQIKANTDGGASAEAIRNTFVYTVLLMEAMGAVMYLVYGRLNRRRPPHDGRVGFPCGLWAAVRALRNR